MEQNINHETSHTQTKHMNKGTTKTTHKQRNNTYEKQT